MLLNITKSILKGLFPYIFSNYILTDRNTSDKQVVDAENIILTRCDNIACNKTKKKLMYSINTINTSEFLKSFNYKNNVTDYEFKLKFHGNLHKSTDRHNKKFLDVGMGLFKNRDNKTKIKQSKFGENIYNDNFYNNLFFRRNRLLNIRKRQRLNKEIYILNSSRSDNLYRNKLGKL